jgi:membrane protein
MLKIVGRLGPHSTVQTLRGPITSVVRHKGGAGALLGVGLLFALWSASGYIGAFMRASNVIYEVPEGRRFWKLRPLQLAVTVVMVLAAALVAIAIVVTGPLARAIGDQIGLGSGAVLAWDIAKWPVLLAIVVTMFAILYYASPNVRLPGFHWLSPGAILAVLIWLVASVGFGVYVANFGSYNKTYGTLAGMIIFLVWMWITNLALLLGAEFNAELERGRELHAGDHDAENQLKLPPRQEPKHAN